MKKEARVGWVALAGLAGVAFVGSVVQGGTEDPQPVVPATVQSEPVAVSTLTPSETPLPVVADLTTVTEVVDGDTLKVSSGQTIRLVGVDTPERGQCGYDKAKEHLTVLLADDPVQLVAVPGRDDKDRYGRLLRYVVIPALADEDAGLNQIESGLGVARYDSRDGYGEHPKQAAYIAADAKVPAYACPAAKKPSPSATVKPTKKPTVKPSPKATATRTTTDEPESSYYANCAAARAAGVAPLYAGEPGYRAGLDRDKDGVACE